VSPLETLSPASGRKIVECLRLFQSSLFFELRPKALLFLVISDASGKVCLHALR
jgi:hypothetical protein